MVGLWKCVAWNDPVFSLFPCFGSVKSTVSAVIVSSQCICTAFVRLLRNISALSGAKQAFCWKYLRYRLCAVHNLAKHQEKQPKLTQNFRFTAYSKGFSRRKLQFSPKLNPFARNFRLEIRIAGQWLHQPYKAIFPASTMA